MSYLEKERDLQNMVVSGQLMDAFEKYYADNCTLVESTGDSIAGKDNARQHELEFLGKVEEFHGAGIDKITSNEEDGTTMTESWMDVTFKGGTRVKLEHSLLLL